MCQHSQNFFKAEAGVVVADFQKRCRFSMRSLSFIVPLEIELRIGAASQNPAWSTSLVIAVAKRSARMLPRIITEGFKFVAVIKSDQHECLQENDVFVELTVCCLGS